MGEGGSPERGLAEVVAVMAKLGTVAFGGPAVHVAMLRDEAVRRRRWLEDTEFLDLFAAVSVLPGPSSTQLAIVLSRRRAGWSGLVLGGMCFIAPAMTIVLGLAWAYRRYHSTPTGGGLLYGVEPVVVSVVLVALWELGRAALKRHWLVIIGAGALAAYFARINVLVALVAGGLAATLVQNRHRLTGTSAFVPILPVLSTVATARVRPGSLAVLSEFAKLGVIVFGSGYLLGGVPAALIATAGIFVPSFIMVSVLEPIVGRVRRSAWLAPALEGATVAALGLMAGVTVDLGRGAIVDPFTGVLAAVALIVTLKWRPNGVWLVAGGAAVGLAHALL